MFWKFTILLGVAVRCLGHEHAVSHQSVVLYSGHHGALSHFGHQVPEHHDEYARSYPLYEFAYKVDDPHTHDYKGQSETRDGDKVKGMYWLIQPDGLKRTVKYYVDKDSGFNADVEYSDPLHHKPEHYEENHHPTSEIYNVIDHLPPHHYHHVEYYPKHHYEYDHVIKPYYYHYDDHYSH